MVSFDGKISISTTRHPCRLYNTLACLHLTKLTIPSFQFVSPSSTEWLVMDATSIEHVETTACDNEDAYNVFRDGSSAD